MRKDELKKRLRITVLELCWTNENIEFYRDALRRLLHRRAALLSVLARRKRQLEA